jgi:hypothetical protein
MLQLPNVTLIALTGKDILPHLEAIQKSCEGIEWGDVKLIYQPTIRNIDDWNYKIIYELHSYVDTEFAMLIHADGYVINPHLWKPKFLDYDYIGAPWPLPRDNYSYRTPTGELIRVGNSVSIRSKRLLELPKKLNLEWKSYYGNTNEDGFLNVHNRDTLRHAGCKFAPLEVACYFSKEHEIEENKGVETFAFHTVDV